MDSKYIPMDQYDGAWQFVDPDDDTSVLPDDISAILPLTKDYSAELWTHYISSKTYHLMLMDRSEWPNSEPRITIEHSLWPYQNAEEKLELAEKLTPHVPYATNETIYFFWTKEQAVETTWTVFLRNWSRFMFDDEGCILIAPQHLTSIIFCLVRVIILERTLID